MSVNTEKPARKKRWDAGTMIFTERDLFALSWIVQQYAIRLDHLQRLLSSYARGEEPLSLEATRKLVARWMRAGWVEAQRLRGGDPLWVWPTRWGLRNVGLGYTYRNMEHSLDSLVHLYAINEIRLHYEESDTRWVSERQLWQEAMLESGRKILHRPDAERHSADGTIIAIKVELSKKKEADWAENLMELVRGEGYLQIRAKHGVRKARTMSQSERSQYAEIWYWASPSVCKQVQRVCTRLVEQGALSEKEAERIFVKLYPLVRTGEQKGQEEEKEVTNV